MKAKAFLLLSDWDLSFQLPDTVASRSGTEFEIICDSMQRQRGRERVGLLLEGPVPV